MRSHIKQRNLACFLSGNSSFKESFSKTVHNTSFVVHYLRTLMLKTVQLGDWRCITDIAPSGDEYFHLEKY
jgi:hypothetical protein